MKRCNIIGTNINVTTMEDTLNEIKKNLSSIKGNYICVSNVHTTVMAHENSDYKIIQNSSYMSLPDGKPLSIVSKRKGFKKAERVTGPDLMGEVFRISQKEGYTHYFYGSTENTLQDLKKNLKKNILS